MSTSSRTRPSVQGGRSIGVRHCYRPLKMSQPCGLTFDETQCANTKVQLAGNLVDPFEDGEAKLANRLPKAKVRNGLVDQTWWRSQACLQGRGRDMVSIGRGQLGRQQQAPVGHSLLSDPRHRGGGARRPTAEERYQADRMTWQSVLTRCLLLAQSAALRPWCARERACWREGRGDVEKGRQAPSNGPRRVKLCFSVGSWTN